MIRPAERSVCHANTAAATPSHTVHDVARWSRLFQPYHHTRRQVIDLLQGAAHQFRGVSCNWGHYSLEHLAEHAVATAETIHHVPDVVLFSTDVSVPNLLGTSSAPLLRQLVVYALRTQVDGGLGVPLRHHWGTDLPEAVHTAFGVCVLSAIHAAACVLPKLGSMSPLVTLAHFVVPPTIWCEPAHPFDPLVSTPVPTTALFPLPAEIPAWYTPYMVVRSLTPPTLCIETLERLQDPVFPDLLQPTIERAIQCFEWTLLHAGATSHIVFSVQGLRPRLFTTRADRSADRFTDCALALFIGLVVADRRELRAVTGTTLPQGDEDSFIYHLIRALLRGNPGNPGTGPSLTTQHTSPTCYTAIVHVQVDHRSGIPGRLGPWWAGIEDLEHTEARDFSFPDSALPDCASPDSASPDIASPDFEHPPACDSVGSRPHRRCTRQ
jgi:hypothetical protein